MKKLSVLVCTLNEPYSIDMLKRLRNILDPQIERYKQDVELLIHDAGRFMPTGTKRNELIKICEGDYFCFIDCDDLIASYYLDEVMKGIELGVDVITMQGWVTTDGAHRVEWTIKLGSDYTERNGQYYRWPNHIAVMKKSLVEHVKFPDIWIQEDYLWSKKIRDLNLLKTEYHINDKIYHYDFRNNKPRSPHK